jgi:hypothetical protein
MHGQHHHSHHGCGQQDRGPEMFYGYCHDSRRMRMMDYPDYMKNVQTGYSNLYGGPASAMQPLSAAMQPMVDALTSMMRTPTSAATQPAYGHQHHHQHGHHHHGCDCGCHDDRECGCCEQDCSCSCCIRCADVVEYARCGETRRIPITFNNDTRRERDITLQLGDFATESGQNVNWDASLSTTQFKLAPCGETTVLLSVPVNCSRLGTPSSVEGQSPTVDNCKVVYATLRADGCTVRPLVIAIAVLPDHCGAHQAGCGCGCCCN